jgi:DNA polymerase-3 subunit alpha
MLDKKEKDFLRKRISKLEIKERKVGIEAWYQEELNNLLFHNDFTDSSVDGIDYLISLAERKIKKDTNPNNSSVAYIFGIVDTKPNEIVKYTKGSLPDLDIDFCKDKREQVIQYMRDKYGEDKVSQIGTYATFKPRGSLRAFARTNGYDPTVGNYLAGLVPPDKSGRIGTFDEIIEDDKTLLNTKWPEVVELARKAEGLRNQAGVHAAGLVVSDVDIKERLPLFLGKHKEVTAQFDMHDVEEIGLVKFDFLGLRNLTIINDTCELIKENHNIELDPNEFEDGDERVYSEIFKQGRLEGIFQFETSGGFKDTCMQVIPKSIKDLSTITALFRPGPLETGMVESYVSGRRKPEKVKYDFPELKPILENTYGIMCYQEQVMRICTDVAGYTLPEADNMRKIIGKKLPDKMKLEREKFVSGCVANGISEENATKLFDDIEGFAAYSFNMAHSVAYSIISYQTAWLKTYYPHEFYTALLNSAVGNQDRMVKYIHATRSDGISILPPDVNKSGAEFTLDNGTILFGLAGIKGIGQKAVEHLIEVRSETEFGVLEDLVRTKVKKDVLAALAECGALEEITDLSREQIKEHAAMLIKHFGKVQKWEERAERYRQREAEIKQAVSEGKKPPRRLPKLPERPELEEIEPGKPLSRKDRLKLERNTIGFYLTGHPLDDYPGLVTNAQYTISDLQDGKAENKENIRVPIVVSSITKRRSRANKDYATLIVEDQTGRIEATVFSRSWSKIGTQLEEEMVGVLHGRINKEASEDSDSPPIIRISVNDIKKVDRDIYSEIKEISVTLKDGTTVIVKPEENQDILSWQQAAAYCDNMKRMGY